MILTGRLAILFIAVVLWGCEKTATISQRASNYVPGKHISEVKDNDPMPVSVKTFLNSNTYPSKKKFPLAYYLIQEEDIRLLYEHDFDERIAGQLYMTISGVKYYKLFVSPDLEASYSFLKHGYRFIGPDETEFFAASSGQRTLVVWSPGKEAFSPPFIVKTELDERDIPQKSLRVPAQVSADSPPSIHMIFQREIKGTKEKIEGQNITAIPVL